MNLCGFLQQTTEHCPLKHPAKAFFSACFHIITQRRQAARWVGLSKWKADVQRCITICAASHLHFYFEIYPSHLLWKCWLKVNEKPLKVTFLTYYGIQFVHLLTFSVVYMSFLIIHKPSSRCDCKHYHHCGKFCLLDSDHWSENHGNRMTLEFAMNILIQLGWKKSVFVAIFSC